MVGVNIYLFGYAIKKELERQIYNIILMTLIGYLADKTDFGRKEKKADSKVKKNQEKENINEEENLESDIQVSLATDTNSDNKEDHSDIEKLDVREGICVEKI